MPRALSLLADAGPALNDGRLDGLKLQRKPELAGNTAQFLFALCYVRLPIAVPHHPSLGIHAGQAGTRPVQPLLIQKTLPVDIAERHVRHPEVMHIPRVNILGA